MVAGQQSYVWISMEHPTECAYIALGSNLGKARENVLRAFDCIDQLPTTRVTMRSRLYQSKPLGMQGDDVVNAVVKIATQLSAESLMSALLSLENQFGRQRSYGKTARTLDLDLIFFADLKLNTPFLTLPHPRWQERAFVLLPLLDVEFAGIDSTMLNSVDNQEIFLID